MDEGKQHEADEPHNVCSVEHLQHMKRNPHELQKVCSVEETVALETTWQMNPTRYVVMRNL